MKFLILFLGMAAFLAGVRAHGDDGPEHDEFPNVGPNYAVTAASRDLGFQLSAKALKTLGIAWFPSAASNAQEIPASALVYFQEHVGVYRLRDNWFHLIPVKILKSTATQARIDSNELRSGDAVVSQGVGFLRVTEMSLFSASRAAHVH